MLLDPKVCQWCYHEWHDSTCWCECIEATDYPEPDYCDKCGANLNVVGEFVIFEESPIAFDSYDDLPIKKGDLAVFCGDCHSKLEIEETE